LPSGRTHGTPVDPAGRQWQERRRRSAFLDGYDAAAGAAGIALARREEMDGLLELFILEKAAYELQYEVDNRPDWVRIPINGLLDILDRTR
jgi:maltose alpha-D-glucosyltransferase/alpha-amylase